MTPGKWSLAWEYKPGIKKWVYTVSNGRLNAVFSFDEEIRGTDIYDKVIAPLRHLIERREPSPEAITEREEAEIKKRAQT